jgi:hypothetical protein
MGYSALRTQRSSVARPRLMSMSQLAIVELFESLRDERGLDLRRGEFDTKAGDPWLALYSTEPSAPVHRYAFATWWAADTVATAVAWVMLNPATGDTDGKPRPILSRCRNQSTVWGYDGLIIVNLFAFRHRDPKVLLGLDEAIAIGPHNDRVLERVSDDCGQTIAAWGDGGAAWERSRTIRPMLHNAQCLPKNGRSLSLKGQPFYPKGIRLDTHPVALPLLTEAT